MDQCDHAHWRTGRDWGHAVKITITTTLNDDDEDGHIRIDADGMVMEIGSSDDESFHLSDVLIVPDMIRAAHEAGLRGEPLEVEQITKSEEE
jgi:hypothetical protein